MSEIYPQRMTPRIEGDFVVFLIGMRINTPWKIHKWWPVFSAMPKMLHELDRNPQLGCLGYVTGMKVIVQYWRTFEHLEAYARSKEHAHLPAWKSFNQSVGRSRGAVGIWHETYKVKAGEYEGIYSGMPAFGLGKAGALIAASDATHSARDRIGN